MKEQSVYIYSKREDPFARIPKAILDSASLSWKAKGVLSYLLSKPVDWTVNLRDIRNRATDGRDSAITAMNELRKAGFVKLERLTDEGKVTKWRYLVADQPIFSPQFANKSPQTAFPEVEKPEVEKPEVVKPILSKTDVNREVILPRMSAPSGATPDDGNASMIAPTGAASPARAGSDGEYSPDYVFEVEMFMYWKFAFHQLCDGIYEPMKKDKAKVTSFFQVWGKLSNALDVTYVYVKAWIACENNPVPKGFDRLWKSRRALHCLGKFLDNFQDIKNEIGWNQPSDENMKAYLAESIKMVFKA
jgi:hypothetical protein